jgi:hypothetical protein
LKSNFEIEAQIIGIKIANNAIVAPKSKDKILIIFSKHDANSILSKNDAKNLQHYQRKWNP